MPKPLNIFWGRGIFERVRRVTTNQCFINMTKLAKPRKNIIIQHKPNSNPTPRKNPSPNSRIYKLYHTNILDK